MARAVSLIAQQAHKTAHIQQQPGREEEAQKDRDSMYNSLSRSRERVTMQRMRINNLSSSGDGGGRGGREERESGSEGGSGVVGGNRILLTGFGQPVSVLEQPWQLPKGDQRTSAAQNGW
eukprot:CAMPEP_0173132022 /NCGR_PEP_ID=MMETSP1102-20130122/60995_1 /TAXON_ID=49646 /ORGANISM="Geminigera sp., Strain Caron Lab Isolate" /LENGTH=119 /DNA_ID=CAMNT_0014043463 /DNA_START=386 /DNA_END=742 /DNA_ORIENTATION=+